MITKNNDIALIGISKIIDIYIYIYTYICIYVYIYIICNV